MKLTILGPGQSYFRAEVGKGLINQMGGMGLLFKILEVGRDISFTQFLKWKHMKKLTPITESEAFMTIAPRVKAMPTSDLSYRRVKYKQRKQV